MQSLRKDEFPCKIFFYTQLRKEKIAFNDLMRLAKKRIALLRSFETIKDHRIFDMESYEDEISHFACRLVCCNIPWVLCWFITSEMRLFTARLKNMAFSDIKNFFYTRFLQQTKDLEFKNGIYTIGRNTEFSDETRNENKISDVFEMRVHFSKAPGALRDGKTILYNGYFILKEETQPYRHILINEFNIYLQKKMYQLRDNFAILNDERFTNIASDLFVEQKAISNQLSIILSNSPPCINLIINIMKKDRHLKFSNRQILIRYLKDSGLSVNDCIEFFRSNFSCDQTRFEREFVYTIRHNYGLEGKRANYKTFSCIQIIGMNTCPLMIQTAIPEVLETNGLADLEDTIKQEISTRNFTKACTIICEKKNKKENMPIITSPVAFFKNSQ